MFRDVAEERSKLSTEVEYFNSCRDTADDSDRYRGLKRNCHGWDRHRTRPSVDGRFLGLRSPVFQVNVANLLDEGLACSRDVFYQGRYAHETGSLLIGARVDKHQFSKHTHNLALVNTPQMRQVMYIYFNRKFISSSGQ